MPDRETLVVSVEEREVETLGEEQPLEEEDAEAEGLCEDDFVADEHGDGECEEEELPVCEDDAGEDCDAEGEREPDCDMDVEPDLLGDMVDETLAVIVFEGVPVLQRVDEGDEDTEREREEQPVDEGHFEGVVVMVSVTLPDTESVADEEGDAPPVFVTEGHVEAEPLPLTDGELEPEELSLADSDVDALPQTDTEAERDTLPLVVCVRVATVVPETLGEADVEDERLSVAESLCD